MWCAGGLPVQVSGARQPRAGADDCVSLQVCTICRLDVLANRIEIQQAVAVRLFQAPTDPPACLHPALKRLLQQELRWPHCRDHGIEAETDETRGFDHGVFVPLLALMPEADVPVIAMSLVSSLDPKVRIDTPARAAWLNARIASPCLECRCIGSWQSPAVLLVH